MQNQDATTLDHGGQQYEINKICDLMDGGLDEKSAIRTLYPTVPAASMKYLVPKVKKHPYYVARKDLKMNILAAKGPELQENLLHIALEGRSERNRLEATNSALDRVYGNAKDEEKNKPQFVFNFSFGGKTETPKLTTEIIEGETV